MIILGVNSRHGDSSACLIKDGKILSASEEERFVKIKHCSHFPVNSIKFCLKENNIDIKEVDYIAINTKFSYNFINKVFFILKNIFINFSFDYFPAFNIFKTKRDHVSAQLFNIFRINLSKKIINVPHHLSHLFSTMYFLNENKNDLAFSFDGSGDFSTIETYLVNGKNYKLLKKSLFPDSLGFYYMTFTQFLGFEDYGDEYKVMGLAAYGKPIFADKIKKLIKSYDPFALDLKYFNLPMITYHKHSPVINTLYNKNFIELFGQPRINNDDKPVEKIYADYASSMQKVFEDVVLSNLKNLKKKYNSKKLYLTGGCAFNTVLVGKIVQSKIFEKVIVGPNPGDAGGALGAALYTSVKEKIEIENNSEQAFLGPNYSNDFIKKDIIDKITHNNKYRINFYENFDDITSKVAKIIDEQKIIFWFQDRMEWGPRALGNRSILANPTEKNIKEIINLNIKKRELFRPFAPVVLKEHADNHFEMHNHESEYMNFVFNAKEKTKTKYSGIVHIDGTSRVQTVDKTQNKKLYSLIQEFYKITNCPMLINTSLNIRGPIALNPTDAFNYFKESETKCLVLNNWVIELIN